MRNLRPLLLLVMAWLMAFQAVAGVGHCRHAATPSSGPQSDLHAQHAGMDHAAMQHADMAQAPDAAPPWSDCACGCHCAASHCAASCPALGSTSARLLLIPATQPLRAHQPSTAVVAAHGLDLLRPPSIS